MTAAPEPAEIARVRRQAERLSVHPERMVWSEDLRFLLAEYDDLREELRAVRAALIAAGERP